MVAVQERADRATDTAVVNAQTASIDQKREMAENIAGVVRMRGRWISLSIPRRLVADYMHFSADVPLSSVQREMCLEDVAAARRAGPERTPWSAIFVKAYALVAAEFPELRRAYLQLPWPHFYEYPTSVASVTVERAFGTELGVCFATISNPATLAVNAIGRLIHAAKQPSFEQTRTFQRLVRVARYPRPLRRALWWIALNIGRYRANYFGTFALSTAASLGAALLEPRSPLTTFLTYGVISGEGRVNVRITIDHRVLDGATAARVLKRLEETLQGPLADELRGLATTVPSLPHVTRTPSMVAEHPLPA